MTTGYDKALAEAAPVLQRFVVEHPFVRSILDGGLTMQVYAAYLRETYYLVGQTPHFLSTAAGRTEEEWLQDWFLDLAVDERHHDRLCVHDIRNLGFEPDEYLSGLPGLGAWTMISQNHYLATTKDTAGILGFAAATEGLGAQLGPQVAEAMTKYSFAPKALSFLRVHAAEDQDHIARVQDAFNRCAESAERFELMLQTWIYTLRAYAVLFSDARERAGAALDPPAG
jgi:pyrroloquinoline quinone (PQQ) biosynthesis protein C